MLRETKFVDVVRVKNKLLTPPYCTLFMNVIFKDNIAGEIQIRLGKKGVSYESNHFYYEL